MRQRERKIALNSVNNCTLYESEACWSHCACHRSESTWRIRMYLKPTWSSVRGPDGSRPVCVLHLLFVCPAPSPPAIDYFKHFYLNYQICVSITPTDTCTKLAPDLYCLGSVILLEIHLGPTWCNQESFEGTNLSVQRVVHFHSWEIISSEY